MLLPATRCPLESPNVHRSPRRSIALLSLVAFLIVIYIANVLSPPPPSWRAVAITALAAWLFVPWAWWIDQHRQAR